MVTKRANWDVTDKDRTDKLEMTEIAKDFIINQQRRKYFGSF